MSNIVFEGFHINKVFNGIINDEDLDANEKIILISISFYMDGKIEEEPYMALSIKEIARLIKCAESTANRVIKKLVDKGYLERVKRGQGNPNIYIFKGWRKWQ